MSEVWAVSEGEYSDYHVVCVCPTEEMANAVAEKLLVGSLPAAWTARYSVQSFPFFTEPPDIVYELTIDIADVETGQPREYTTGHLPAEAPTNQCYHWVSGSYHEPIVLSLHVTGMDHKRVRKTFSEQWAQAKAEAPILIATRRAEIAEQEAKYGPLGGIVGTSWSSGRTMP